MIRTQTTTTRWWSFFSMIKMLTQLFRQPTAAELAKKELAEYQRLLLTAQANAAYQTKMVEFYTEGIGRLAKQAK